MVASSCAAIKAERKKKKRADYLLRYTRDFPIAVTEAKAEYKKAADGLQQAKEYAEILDLKFAYATNGKEIIEFDFHHRHRAVVETFSNTRRTVGAAAGWRKIN
jgi:type I restriction enzyme, R subunit